MSGLFDLRPCARTRDVLDSPFSSGEPILCVWGRGLGRPHQAAQQVKTKPLHTWAREARVERV